MGTAIRTALFATAAFSSPFRGSSAARREYLRQSLLATVDLLHRRRADLIGDDAIGDYVDLDWLEWNGGTLRLTVVGHNICTQMRALGDMGEQQR